jgi:hypothetical protein
LREFGREIEEFCIWRESSTLQDLRITPAVKNNVETKEDWETVKRGKKSLVHQFVHSKSSLVEATQSKYRSHRYAAKIPTVLSSSLNL